jgi:hypothetical protein
MYLCVFYLFRAVVLFRDIEHCGVSSVNGTSSIQFPEFRPDKISMIPRNSSQFQNSVQFLQLQLIPDPTNSRNSGIQSKLNRTHFRNRTELQNWNRFLELDGIGRNSHEFRFDSNPGIASTYCRLTFEHNKMHLREGGTDSGMEFRELSQSGTDRNWWELIPGAEPVPPCSTLRNRMHSLYLFV